jgi:hypothetical protein
MTERETKIAADTIWHELDGEDFDIAVCALLTCLGEVGLQAECEGRTPAREEILKHAQQAICVARPQDHRLI